MHNARHPCESFLTLIKFISSQKEASVIVSSIIKAAKAHQAEWGLLPSDMGDISQYAKFQKCITNNSESLKMIKNMMLLN